MKPLTAAALLLAAQQAIAAQTMPQANQPDRPRIRDLGVSPGILPTGPLNAITDVSGVKVGHVTITQGDNIRTGVTAVLPHAGNIFQNKPIAAVHIGNGFGKAAGLAQIAELGTLESPIILTNTLSVAAGIEGAVRWTLDQPGNESVRSVNAAVGECNDGRLNDIRAMAVTPGHVIEAINNAKPGPVAEGAIGAGRGMVSFGFKSGIGTSSRKLPDELGGWTLGALVLSNFGGVLTIDGARIGEALGRYPYRDALRRHQEAEDNEAIDPGAIDTSDGSIIIVIATDAPLDTRSLERLAARATLGLARTGSAMNNGSGDFVIAFSTAQTLPHTPDTRTHTIETVPSSRLSPLFLAAVEATEEAIYNSLTKATTTTGNNTTFEALDIDTLKTLLD